MNLTHFLVMAAGLLSHGCFNSEDCCDGGIGLQHTERMAPDTINKYTNNLIHESSPYLLQHAHNPVNWYPWGEEALSLAAEQEKPLLISIGYSACHWCHVMERESFEDEEIAAYMNEHFICVKVDREERPDIDQVYMQAIQLITHQGGWPLHCFALPDGTPFYGGTYFPPGQWKSVLTQVALKWQQSPETIRGYAKNLHDDMVRTDWISPETTPDDLDTALPAMMVERMAAGFDHVNGGNKGAPKFPMPVNLLFLLKHAVAEHNPDLLKQVYLTLDKMAMGGIYDGVGGGFARYSTDARWKVPHFEKMLYDNAQLLELYTEAWQWSKNPLYRDVAASIISWLVREMTSSDNGFYSSLDADSEGHEGWFYTWTDDELKEIAGDAYERLCTVYNIRGSEQWEGRYILYRTQSKEALTAKLSIAQDVLEEEIKGWHRKLFAIRAKRARPALDDKVMTNWNALMLKALTKAYLAFDEEDYLNLALKNARFIESRLLDEDTLYHNYKDGKRSIRGFLDDYAFTIDAFIKLYEVTFDQHWLDLAEKLTQSTDKQFFNPGTNLYYYTGDLHAKLPIRKTEVYDNVTPSPNSVMAGNLLQLGLLLDHTEWMDRSRQMLRAVAGRMPEYPVGFGHWALVYEATMRDYHEVAIVGPEASLFRQQIAKTYMPYRLFLGGEEEGRLPLLENKLVQGRTTVYICVDKTCKMPVTTVEEAIAQLK